MDSSVLSGADVYGNTLIQLAAINKYPALDKGLIVDLGG